MEHEERKDYRTSITLSWTNMRINIHKKTLKALGYPKYVRFLFNQKDRKMCIQATNFGDNNSISLPDYLNMKSCELNSTNIILLIWALFGFEREKTYLLNGTFHRGYKIIEFDINEAKKLEQKRKDIIYEA